MKKCWQQNSESREGRGWISSTGSTIMPESFLVATTEGGGANRPQWAVEYSVDVQHLTTDWTLPKQIVIKFKITIVLN